MGQMIPSQGIYSTVQWHSERKRLETVQFLLELAQVPSCGLICWNSEGLDFREMPQGNYYVLYRLLLCAQVYVCIDRVVLIKGISSQA